MGRCDGAGCLPGVGPPATLIEPPLIEPPLIEPALFEISAITVQSIMGASTTNPLIMAVP
jgi:hypothetical protein